jgi:quinolinate synthase
VYRLQQEFPGKEFVMADGCIGCRLHCPYMKMIDLPQVKRSLEEDVFEVRVSEEVAAGARRSLERMIAVPRDR